MTQDQRLEAWSRAFFRRLSDEHREDERERFSAFAERAESYFREEERRKEQRRLRKDHYRLQQRARG